MENGKFCREVHEVKKIVCRHVKEGGDSGTVLQKYEGLQGYW
jgi:hypothetical protein